MQRTICRIIRGRYRNFRENDSPAIATEEVRQKNKSKEDFSSPKCSISETFLGWTTGIILTYELTHEQRRRNCIRKANPRGETSKPDFYKNCPLFTIAKQLVTQPAIGLYTVHGIRSPPTRRSVPLGPRKSIDQTPFLYEPEQFYPKDVQYTKQDSYDESDDEGIHFDPEISRFDEVRARKPSDREASSRAEKFTSDLFSVLGAFKFLTVNEADIQKKEICTEEALDILKKGAELGSSRALYNIGVAYDRMKETDLSKEYYRRAADLGHPLASYNLAVMSLKEGNLQEGINLMKYAADNGVEEALENMKLF